MLVPFLFWWNRVRPVISLDPHDIGDLNCHNHVFPSYLIWHWQCKLPNLSKKKQAGGPSLYLLVSFYSTFSWTCLWYRFCNKHLPSVIPPSDFLLFSFSLYIQRLMLQSVAYRFCKLVKFPFLNLFIWE